MEWASFTPGVSGAVPTGSLWAARVNNAQLSPCRISIAFLSVLFPQVTAHQFKRSLLL